ncbi:HYR domain-containing protein [Mangrovimonas aestuarii]|uniref:HYR domain-containing protein n=1 Tax=Mangrovimonas aestuarii TaxID=3018443 RepID=UPI002379AF8C|nr:HYR domain-containing protein [Mangrovimonas aestuarii]
MSINFPQKVVLALSSLVLIYLSPCCKIYGQSISFGSSGLVGESVLYPTSLDFGPDDRLYVSQQNGMIWAFTIERDGAPMGDGTYTVNTTSNPPEEITVIQTDVPNHNDQGILNPAQQRLITGIMTAGTAENPIIYVTSSDYLFGGGGAGDDTNLDTNSGVLSKLEWNGASWNKVDLIRGLPRCEEQHATNGMDIFVSPNDGNTYLLISQGGNSNKGAPSNNFAGTPEYFLSGAILIVNLTQLEGMTVYTDPRTNTDYVYDLPTLNDPTRADIAFGDPDFPYPAGHPYANNTIDVGDPFGGNNSLNQAFPEAGGPIQIFSSGYRNPYDVVITQNGRIYTSDNGPNSGWGGLPKIYSKADDTFLGDESTIAYDPINHYITNELNENGSYIIGDPLHFVGTISDANFSYYGGHPNPILAFPDRAMVISYEHDEVTDDWVATNTHDLQDLLPGTSGYFNDSFTIGDFPERSDLGEYLLDEPVGSTQVNILDVINFSTNGIAEYTASNFGGAMQGDILTASFNGDINRYKLNAAGNVVEEYEAIFSGFGNIPLDVIAMGDDHVFPGTVWAATYGSNSITIFEPTAVDCSQPGDLDYVSTEDNDGDGYSNQDEIDNGTNHCSQGSKPRDNDGDFISDLNDNDDDNDGIDDINDAFALDPDNGLTNSLPIVYPFWNNDPGTGFYGLGFTGLMINNATDYLDQFNEEDLSFGGAAGKATVDLVSGGDAHLANNNQENAFQFGINVDTSSNPFTIHSQIESPYFSINGSQTDPIDFQSYGIFIGTGDQDNYLKFVLTNGTLNSDNVNGLQVALEDQGGLTTNNYDVPNILSSSAVDFYLSVDPAANTVQPYYSLDGGQTLNVLGSPIGLPSSFLDPSDSKGLAVGIISTSRGNSGPTPFTATWDLIEVYENQNGVLSIAPDPLEFGLTPTSNSLRTKYIDLNNEGGPTDSPITVTEIAFSGGDASYFSHSAELPIVVNPGTSVKVPINFISTEDIGLKSASLSVTHNGSNSPNLITVAGELTSLFSPIVRINAGGPEVIASDGGPIWEDNAALGGTVGPSYNVSSGGSYSVNASDMVFANRDASIPDYIDETTYTSVMNYDRGVDITSIPMIFSIMLPNGEYIVNMYFANLYHGTQDPGQRIFSVNIENELAVDHLDPSAIYGHRIAGMVQHNATVTDGVLEIQFISHIDEPLINAIEIMAVQSIPIDVDPISDQINCVGTQADFTVTAFGGDPEEPFSFSINGQPGGIDIEPNNGLIYGTVAVDAASGGPNGDGFYNVEVTVSKSGSSPVITIFNWTVNEDTEAPIITNCPTDLIFSSGGNLCNAVAPIVPPSATDNCSTNLNILGIRSDTLPLTDPFPLGVTIITWTATDDSGNTSLECVQNIEVIDNESPEINCPPEIIQSSDIGLCEANLTIINPTALDNCSTVFTFEGSRSDELNLNDPYPVGTTTITWTVMDEAGNISDACVQTVTITDGNAPIISCSGDINQAADLGLCEASVTIDDPTATDDCSTAFTFEATRSDGLDLSAPYPVGTTTINWTSIDEAGNTSDTCEQTVTITDGDAPIISCSGDINQAADFGLCEASITIDDPTAIDDCSSTFIFEATRSDGLDLNAPYPEGTTTISWIAIDETGNTSDPCIQTITIFDDESPEIVCSTDITVTVDLGEVEASVIISDPIGTDNCSEELIFTPVRSDALSLNDPYPLGDTTISWTAMDQSGQTSLSCDQIVSVVETAEFNITLNVSLQGRLDYSGPYEITFYSTNDLITPAYVFNEVADSAGNLSLSSAISLDNYIIVLKYFLYLQRAESISISSNGTFNIEMLLAGDANNNNTINISDYGILEGSFGLSEGNTGYSPNADFNGDQTVNIIDFSLLSGNYGGIGETQND